MARPENRSEARALSLTLPTETFNYLVLLATLGKLGRTENEVATHILVREAYAMYERGFHNERVPPPAEEWGVTIDPRTETKHRAAACRERAAQYEALAAEAKLRGDNEMSASFASSAVEERMEAQRLDDSLKPWAQRSAHSTSDFTCRTKSFPRSPISLGPASVRPSIGHQIFSRVPLPRP